MATIQFEHGMIRLEFIEYDPSNGLGFISSAPSEWGDLQWGFYNDEGWRVFGLTGDFTYDAKGIPKSGAVTGLQVHQENLIEGDKFDWSLKGFSFDVSLLRPMFMGKGDEFDPKNLFFRSMLSGDDTLTLQSRDFLAGDGWIVIKGETMVGGDDKISLSSRNAKYDSFLAGDALDLDGRLVGGKDTIQGGARTDVLWGDTSRVRKGASLTGGDDLLRGEDGDDELFGEARFNDGRLVGGSDMLYGGNGSDQLYGEVQFNDGTILGGRDFLYGGAGNDLLAGGAGRDVLEGGTGRDTFVFDNALHKKSNVDDITDFNHKDDAFQLDRTIFKGLPAESLKNFRFKIVEDSGSKKGIDKSDRILYDKADGNLYFDQDGSGSKHSPIRFAVVKDNADVRADDFLVV